MPTTPEQLTAAQGAAQALYSGLDDVLVSTLSAAQIVALSGQASALSADIAAFTPAAPPSGAEYGVFNNPLSPAQFAALTGEPTTWGMAFATVNEPADIAKIGSFLVSALGGQGLANIIAPVNICTGAPSTNSAGLIAAASGLYNPYYIETGEALVAGGFARACIRLPWEFNLGWAPWSANNGKGAPQSSFIPAQIMLVNALRSVPGQEFTFIWNPARGDQGVGNLALYYPGDAYVDYVGLDPYDTSAPPYPGAATNWNTILNGSYGLNWLSAFATQHSKKIALPEWGLWSATYNGPNTWPNGGGDDPLYITNMLAWIKANNVLSSYWNQALPLSKAPNALAAYRAAF